MSAARAGKLRLGVIAGEASGDALGASVAQALRGRGVALELVGVGGPALQAEGLASIFPQADINIMGVAAALRRAPLLLRRLGDAARSIAASQPDLLLTIDSPDFGLRVARRVRARAPDIPIVHWVCPSVWAWRPGRAPRMAPYVDRVLCLLPFEPDALRRLSGPQGIYVGHPLIERLDALRPQTAAEAAARADVDRPAILFLPGSRRSEVARLMPVLKHIATRLAAAHPGARFRLPAVEHVRPDIETALASWSVPVEVLRGEAEKHAAFRTARAAVAASGTATLELALAKVPLVGVYRVAHIEALIGQYLIHAHSALLPNLVLGRNAVPEFLQWSCTPEAVATALEPLLAETEQRAAQLAAFDEIERRMRAEALTPSARTAQEILALAGRGKAAP